MCWNYPKRSKRMIPCSNDAAATMLVSQLGSTVSGRTGIAFASVVVSVVVAVLLLLVVVVMSIRPYPRRVVKAEVMIIDVLMWIWILCRGYLDDFLQLK